MHVQQFTISTDACGDCSALLAFGSLAEAADWLDRVPAVLLPGDVELPVTWAAVAANLARPLGNPRATALHGTVTVEVRGPAIRHVGPGTLAG